MSQTSRKFFKFVLFLIVLIILIWLWIAINKNGEFSFLTKIVGDSDISNMIFKQGLGALVVIVFISLIVYILSLLGLRMFRFMN